MLKPDTLVLRIKLGRLRRCNQGITLSYIKFHKHHVHEQKGLNLQSGLVLTAETSIFGGQTGSSQHSASFIYFMILLKTKINKNEILLFHHQPTLHHTAAWCRSTEL